MLLKTKSIAIALLLASSGCTLPTVHAGTAGVCPAARNDRVVQINIFDGKPEELAFLAPDDEQGAANRYTLGYIYDKGGTVTIECKYKTGQTRTIELKDRVARCDYSTTPTREPRLACK